jgi:predicted DNA-binding transcriptional regulator AlpA
MPIPFENRSRLVRPQSLKNEYGIADSTIRGWEAAGAFPKRRKFGPRVSGWFRDEFEKALRAMDSRK